MLYFASQQRLANISENLTCRVPETRTMLTFTNYGHLKRSAD